jgi:hypothetical protein
VAGRDFLGPAAQGQRLFFEAARPERFDEKLLPVRFGGRFINSLGLNHGTFFLPLDFAQSKL